MLEVLVQFAKEHPILWVMNWLFVLALAVVICGWPF